LIERSKDKKKKKKLRLESSKVRKGLPRNSWQRYRPRNNLVEWQQRGLVASEEEKIGLPIE
jgi:hypothetical protein